MQNVIDKIEWMFAGLGGFLGWFFGGFDGFLYALVVFVVCDYFTGVLAAAVKHELSSEVGFKGIAKKVMCLRDIFSFSQNCSCVNPDALRKLLIRFPNAE